MPISGKTPDGTIRYVDGPGNWRRLNTRLWVAPNGDTVSVRSMSLDLRIQLRVNEEFDSGPDVNALRHIRGILER